MAAKGIVKGIITAAVICGLGAGGWGLYKRFGTQAPGSSEKVYVQKVATLNTVDGANLFAHNFAGVIVAQKTVDVKIDTQKTVSEILVKEGDTVKKGDRLLNYDVEQIQIQIDTMKLEIERYQTDIETARNEIEQYEREKQTATGDAALSCTQNILQRKSQIARTEYDIKTKNVELAKLEKSLENAFVTAPIDGTVKDLKEPGSSDSASPQIYYDGYGMDGGSAADVIMKIAAAGDYRVKGTFNEQNSAQIYPGAKVFLRSRTDDSVMLRGEVSEIDTNPQTDNQNMYYGGMSDEMTSSSKYAFYVEPESLEGFMLGQHILIETDNGQEDADKKEGLWLYSSFVLWDGDRNYVWAKNGRDQIEKRYVEIGEINDEGGDCQILSGLTIEDYIAFPSDYIEEGLKTTTNQSDKDIPDNVLNDINEMNGNGADGMMGMEGMEGMPGMEDMEAVPDMAGGNVSVDEDGNMPAADAAVQPAEDGAQPEMPEEMPAEDAPAAEQPAE
ncbi:MAG: efflux RND transporter periplasmic adaptor subunit [Oscillospiraceae bacterium]|nr:efflux RND transporter periplasmic adaptor subunit [Oscillospiraceae bacterium]